MTTRSVRVGIGALLLVAAVALTGCGSDSPMAPVDTSTRIGDPQMPPTPQGDNELPPRSGAPVAQRSSNDVADGD